MIQESIKRILFLVIIYTVSVALIFVVGIISLATTDGNLMIGRITCAFMIIPILYCLYKVYKPKFDFIKEKLSLRKSLMAILVGGIAFGIGFAIRLIFKRYDANEGNVSLSILLFFLFKIFIYAPIMEELIFRHWIFSYLDKYRINKWCILLTSTLLFYIGHIRPAFSGGIDWRLDIIISGTLFFLLYEKTRDVRYCILAHITINALNYFLI